ncbi:MAG: hypothetical protein Tsb0019_31150 [Roseibium sp.]
MGNCPGNKRKLLSGKDRVQGNAIKLVETFDPIEHRGALAPGHNSETVTCGSGKAEPRKHCKCSACRQTATDEQPVVVTFGCAA